MSSLDEHITTPVIVVGQTLYMGTQEGTVVAFDAPTGDPKIVPTYDWGLYVLGDASEERQSP